MDLNKRALAQKVSILYYEKNKSQNEIAEELEISRSYVSQLLSFARDTGIVEIKINVDEFDMRMIRKEIEFKSKFPGLKQAYIMFSETAAYTESNIGKFAAPYIAEMINDAKIIGINPGISVEKTVNSLENHYFTNTSEKKVVQLMGGFFNSSVIASAHPNELVNRISAILGCDCYYLNCPAVIENVKLRKALLQEKSIQSVVNMWDSIDLAIMGIGVADSRSKLFNLFSTNMIEDIEKSGVCGELNINFFDENGMYIPLMEDNKMSIPFEKLKKVRRKVVICFGEHKKKAILGALRGQMIDVLITDSITADAVEMCM